MACCARTYCSIIALFFLLLLPNFTGAAGAAGEYTLAVVPQMPPVVMHTNWTPFVEVLARETGLNIKLKVYEKMNDFEKDFQEGKPDFIFSSPTQIVLARQSQGYIPLVRSSQKIKGVLFVKKDSPITEVSQLEGKTIAFVGSKNL